MNDPKLYLTVESLTISDSQTICKNYFRLLKHNNNEKSTVLDIGCGPGNTTHDVLFPMFKNPISKVVGIDVSKKMVDFANSAYGNSVFSFDRFDIGVEVPEKYVSYFDYVFSFWALQWIQDQRQLFANIHKVMKPNGQLLVFYIAQSKLYDIYQKVWRKPEYCQYIDDFQTAQSPFQKSEDPKNELQAILEEVGFEVGLNSIEPIQLKQSTAASYKDLLTSISPYYHKIPDHLKEKFMEDHFKEISVDGNDDNGYHLNFNNFLVYAKKK